MNGVRFYVANDISNNKLVNDWNLLDLFDDEDISITLKQTDIKDLASNYADYTGSFTVPPTAKNNKSFKYWYDIFNDDQYSQVDTIPCRIDIGGVHFKKGTLKIQSAEKDSNGALKHYTVSFTSDLKSLKDVFGDKKLSDLDFTYSGTVPNGAQFDYNDLFVSDAVMSGNTYRIPLVSTKRLLDDFDTFKYINSGTPNGIKKDELRPSLRISEIINLINNNFKLNIVTTYDEKLNEYLNNSYLWLNKNEDPLKSIGTILDFSGTISTTGDTSPASNDVVYNTSLNYFTLRKNNTHYSSSHQSFVYGVNITTTTANVVSPYKLFLQKLVLNVDGSVDETLTAKQDNEGFVASHDDFITGPNDTLNYTVSVLTLPNNTIVGTYRIVMESKADITLTGLTITTRLVHKLPIISFYNTYYTLASTTDNTIPALFNLNNNVPDMGIYDFLQSLMKMYNIVIIPKLKDDFYNAYNNQHQKPETNLYRYNEYMRNGKEIDITKYVKRGGKITKPSNYKKYEFKHQDAEYGFNKLFKSNQKPERPYGSFIEEYPKGDDSSYAIESKFNLLIFNEMLNVFESGDDHNLKETWVTSNSLDESFEKGVFNKPTIFYQNNMNFPLPSGKRLAYTNIDNTTIPLDKYLLASNIINVTEIDDSLKSSLSFSSEYMFNGLMTKSLYNENYKSQVASIFSAYSRVFEFTAILPKSIYIDLEMNDKLIIGNMKYNINEVKLNLITGEATLKLNNLVEEQDVVETFVDQVPQPPLGFTASLITGTFSGISQSAVKLQWDGATDDYGIAGFQYDRLISGSYNYMGYDDIGTSYSNIYNIATTSGFKVSFDDTTSPQYYRMRTKDIVGQYSSYIYATYSQNDLIPPTIPSYLYGVPDANSIFIQWSGASDNIAIKGYEISYKKSTDGTYSTLPFINSSFVAGNTTIGGLSMSTPYNIRVRTRDTSNNWSVDYKSGTYSTTAPYHYLRSSDSQTYFDSNLCAVLLPSIDIYCSKPILNMYVDDIFYTDVTLTTPFDGGGNFWRIGDYESGHPSFNIWTNGLVMDFPISCSIYTFITNRSSEWLDLIVYEGPFEVGTNEIEDGCGLSTSLILHLYFTKPLSDVIVGDFAYTNNTASTKFNGANRIWKVEKDAVAVSMIINSVGLIIDLYTC